MQAYHIHLSIVQEYKSYLESFVRIRNHRIKEKVDAAFAEGKFLPKELIQFNPSYATGISIGDLVSEGLHPDIGDIFGNFNLYDHPGEGDPIGDQWKELRAHVGNWIGKSLTFLGTIFHSILSEGATDGLRAIIVYPMNALINSQEEEIKKHELSFLKRHSPAASVLEAERLNLDEALTRLRGVSSRPFPIRYGKYTGQEGADVRDTYRETKPHVILTNYMMLELIMTRNSESGYGKRCGQG